MRLSLVLAGIVVFGAFGVTAGQARAQDFERSGVYIGGSWFRVGEQFGNRLNDKLDAALELENPRLSVGDTNGAGAILGLRTGSHFSLELVGERYQDLPIDLTAAGVTSSGDLELYTGMLMGKLYLFTGRIQPYLMAGAGYLRGRARIEGEDQVGHAGLGRAGAGLEIYLAHNWALNVQAAYSRGLSSDFDDLAFFTVGGSVLLRF